MSSSFGEKLKREEIYPRSPIGIFNSLNFHLIFQLTLTLLNGEREKKNNLLFKFGPEVWKKVFKCCGNCLLRKINKKG